MGIAFDGARRRRVYLLRHAEVAYFDEDGAPVSDVRVVALTPRGQREADAMGEMLAHVRFDRVVCSGLPRTRETAARVIGERVLTIEDMPELEEIRADIAAIPDAHQRVSTVAYALDEAAVAGARFVSGELFADFERRVVGAIEVLLREPGWESMALVCHGGTNRMILAWALGAGLRALPAMEQDSCCLNVLDVDVDSETGEMRRALVRAVNVTAHDPVKAEREFTTLEVIAADMAERDPLIDTSLLRGPGDEAEGSA